MIRIGTRDSNLAMWQAYLVQSKLTDLGITSVIVPIKSDGDLTLDQPLYEMGITGIFTKTLDLALLNNKIDIAVHSLKDVPTSYPKGIFPVAYLERENPSDLLVYKKDFNLKENRTIATGSLRRKACWLNEFPADSIVDLRGNVQTRLNKLTTTPTIDAAIFAYAGIKRCEMLEEIKALGLEIENLDWMIPAPAQGTIVVTALIEKIEITESLKKINHSLTEQVVTVERDFLKTIEGGCTTPIGTLAKIEENEINLEVLILNLDGTKKFHTNYTENKENYKTFGNSAALKSLQEGAKEIVDEIKLYFDGK